MGTKITQENSEAGAGLAAATGSTFRRLTLSDDPKRLLYEVAGYLETLRMEHGRAVHDGSEILGYWQTADWLLGLEQLGEHCGKVSGLTPEQYMSNNALSQGGPASNDNKSEPQPPLAPANG